jgi:hypothetical protein
VIQRITYYCYPITDNPRLEHIAARGDWYLMGPPRSAYDKTAAYLRAYQVWPDRALNEWNLLDAYESRQVCELMRNSLRRIEESTYSRAAAAYLQMMGEQTETPAMSFQRYMVEIYDANIRTYAASRCVSRGDPGLPRGLKRRSRSGVDDARLRHPWLRINRVLRVMLHTRWSTEAWLRSESSSSERSRCGARSGARGGFQLGA